MYMVWHHNPQWNLNMRKMLWDCPPTFVSHFPNRRQIHFRITVFIISNFAKIMFTTFGTYSYEICTTTVIVPRCAKCRYSVFSLKFFFRHIFCYNTQKTATDSALRLRSGYSCCRFLSNTYILFTLNELHGIHCNYIFLVGGNNDGRNLRIGG